MNFDLSEQHQKLQIATAQFCKAELAPQALALDAAVPKEAVGIVRANLKKLGAMGYLKLALEDDVIGLCAASEEVAKACPATFLAAMSSAVAFGTAIKLFGSSSQKEKYLPGISSGTLIGAWAVAEEDAGSDLAGTKTTATKEGANWVLNGAKTFVTNAPYADAIVVAAWTDQAAGIDHGLSLFVVDGQQAGLKIGAPLDTMGLRGALGATVSFDNCRLPEEALLGQAGTGRGKLNSVLEYLKLALSSMSVGIGMACMELSTLHGKGRKAFGKPIGLFEGVGAKLAIMFTLNDLGRALTLRAAWATEQKDPESPILTASAKLFTGEGVNEIADLAMQVHGGHGYLKGTPVEKLYRDARFAVIAYGTSEMLRAFIAKDSLDRYKPA
ncbi:MAG: acyl-CoA/acyl-ACP dehydrogenase [Smithellaceae bacterium]|nr:acyl-CoA/acyl-ACP dehydrogenase [Smithellaceae bacterium]